jgi:cold shock CspA family protein
VVGHVRKYVPTGNYGFVTTGDGDIFFHLWVFKTLGGPPPIIGEVVDVSLIPTTNTRGLPRAESVERVSLPESQMGMLEKFDPTRGYGFISSTRGVYYAHKSDMDPSATPKAGDRVRFYAMPVGAGGQRPRACHITFA